METIFVVAYIAFAIYSGYKVVSGRFEFLERQAPLNMIIKFTLQNKMNLFGIYANVLNVIQTI